MLESLSTRNYTNFNTYSTWEGLAVELNYNSEISITVCNIYRPPRDNNSHASNEFNPTLQKINKSLINITLVGDFNIDLPKLNANAKLQEFCDSLAQLDFLTLITYPTGFSHLNATLIDQIYCKSPNPITLSESGILATKISDHMALFSAFNFNINTNYNKVQNILQRSFTCVNMNAFLDEVKLINWQNVFDHSETADPLDTYDIKLPVELDGLMNKHFPLKYVKFNKYKHFKSKWMTNEILLEMKQR